VLAHQLLSVVEEVVFHYTRETSAAQHHLRQQPGQLAPEALDEIRIGHNALLQEKLVHGIFTVYAVYSALA
jgi:hypothetical protein